MNSISIPFALFILLPAASFAFFPFWIFESGDQWHRPSEAEAKNCTARGHRRHGHWPRFGRPSTNFSANCTEKFDRNNTAPNGTFWRGPKHFPRRPNENNNGGQAILTGIRRGDGFPGFVHNFGNDGNRRVERGFGHNRHNHRNRTTTTTNGNFGLRGGGQNGGGFGRQIEPRFGGQQSNNNNFGGGQNGGGERQFPRGAFGGPRGIPPFGGNGNGAGF